MLKFKSIDQTGHLQRKNRSKSLKITIYMINYFGVYPDKINPFIHITLNQQQFSTSVSHANQKGEAYFNQYFLFNDCLTNAKLLIQLFHKEKKSKYRDIEVGRGCIQLKIKDNKTIIVDLVDNFKNIVAGIVLKTNFV